MCGLPTFDLSSLVVFSARVGSALRKMAWLVAQFFLSGLFSCEQSALGLGGCKQEITDRWHKRRMIAADIGSCDRRTWNVTRLKHGMRDVRLKLSL